MTTTTIEWTDVVWNPVRGCTRVSEGCGSARGGGCYAERIAARFSGPGLPFEGFAQNTPVGPRWTGKVELIPAKLNEPLTWRKPCRVFVNSMSDLFHEGLSDDDLDQVFAVMALCPQHTFQILTKRPERMRDYVAQLIQGRRQVVNASAPFRKHGDGAAVEAMLGHVERGFPNVWLGTSVEDQATADERIPHLLATPAAMRNVGKNAAGRLLDGREHNEFPSPVAAT